MTLDELRSGKYFSTEYEDMELFCEDFVVGGVIYKYDKEANIIEEGVIKQVIAQSGNPDWYYKHDYSDFDNAVQGINYSFSGEFVTNNDCYYVFGE